MTSQDLRFSHPDYRPDIDGLRAVAVLSVVVFHAFPDALRGGFIGVDVFFVISGFLISTIIFENLDKGTFRFPTFFARRILRIFPALLLVLSACFAFGWFALLADEYQSLGKHMAAGAGFVANLVRWNEAGYFDYSAETQPLLHLWSLGIEEQFYVAWPILVWLAWPRSRSLPILMILLAVASFGLNIASVRHDAVATFYSPLTRVWELLCGCLLAWVVLYRKTPLERLKLRWDASFAPAIRPARPGAGGTTDVSNFMTIAGVSLLAFGMLRIDKDHGFPGSWAAVPVLAAVLIIAAGPNAWINRVVLSNKLAVWFGLISFPLYLWHWPLLTFARIQEGAVPSRSMRVAALLLSLILAWLTYRLLERRMRAPGNARRKVSVLVALMFAAGGVGYITYERGGFDTRASLAGVTPSIQRLVPDDPVRHAECMGRYGLSREQIRFCRVSGQGRPRIAIVGDSHGAALFQALADQLEKHSAQGLLMIGGRPFVKVVMHGGADQAEIRNSEGGSKATQFVAREESIDSVIMVSRGAVYLSADSTKFDLMDAPAISDRRKVFEADMRAALDLFASKKKQVIFVLENPTLNFGPTSCIDRRPLQFARKQVECSMQKAVFESQHKEYRELMSAILKDYPSVKVFDPALYLCDERACWGKLEGNILYGDDNHLTYRGAEILATELVKIIDRGEER